MNNLLKKPLTLCSALLWVISGVAFAAPVGTTHEDSSPREGAPQSTAPKGIAQQYQNSFLIGTAIKSHDLMGERPATSTLLCREFNAFTAENAMKWQHIQPAPGQFNFAMADELIALAEQCKASVIGHTLVWHQQTPGWVFEDEQGNPVSRDTLLNRLREHIHTLVGRYKGKVYGWDVVNEALNEDGTLRDTPWRRIIGDDFLVYAFRFAREADPGAQLYYNDFNLYKPAKVAGAVRLVKQLAAVGIKVDAVGMQGHYSLFYPSLADIEQSILSLKQAGVAVAITELDISVLPLPDDAFNGADISQSFAAHPVFDPYTNGLPAAQQQQLASLYQQLFTLFLKHADSINRVTFWGTTDADSWRNNWPIRGRTDHPLLFDRHGRPKPAYDAIIQHIK
ncbi:endo-1,4-beta-xylanase [Aestuariibacter sp. GS-14]|uniref:endo-1,4-beta-xylanase n=1 Tax=Aestuariibacter sp. GS-14 TaxID=2590670 RepID=UPI001129BF1F|nr:endo-1,4-beta-xylanase [Aestuariibacter sp. GS-14]TPV56447.1 endo-1,4-beta-xylanase [Aestuariibacter sp. GS-14]